MREEFPHVDIHIWEADAVVLYDWLMTADLNAIPIRHRAEKQALMDLLTRLELTRGIAGVTQAQIDDARELVSRDMGF